MKLYHISDLHIHANVRRNGAVRARLAHIAAQLAPGDLVVATGDITDSGTVEQYAQAAELLQPFKGRIVLAPGNHDYGAGGILYDRLCVERFRRLCAGLESGATRVFSVDGHFVGEVIALDTCLRTGTVCDISQGRVGWWQRWWLRYRLERIRRAGALGVVALHHSPFYQEWYVRLQDAQPFMQAVLGRADYVLMGHEHRQRHLWFPATRPEGQAITHLFGADALYEEDAVITVIPMPEERRAKCQTSLPAPPPA